VEVPRCSAIRVSTSFGVRPELGGRTQLRWSRCQGRIPFARRLLRSFYSRQPRTDVFFPSCSLDVSVVLPIVAIPLQLRSGTLTNALACKTLLSNLSETGRTLKQQLGCGVEVIRDRRGSSSGRIRSSTLSDSRPGTVGARQRTEKS